MGDLRYAFQQKTEEKVVKVQGRDLRISPKESYEVANALRGMNVVKAKQLLQGAIELKTPIPFKRYNRSGVGHRKGHFGPGRFPVNTSREFLKLLNLLEANATFKGMNKEQLVLFHVATHKAASVRHFFKGSPHSTQVTHIEIVAKEQEVKEKQNKEVKHGS
ncbi:TPA: 50S ribosomal protein L22 [archaeon]|uniref:50S ribosomal protein L22 n=1 Tax=Candidatus Naiadarchaeum limnaeum TaxID=2756139 RepID=A0A832X642_9ARCH|nr:50S ribosomal protein L22 [Candidatus Naiadarchaeales archaeon SRR2090153.bin1042]HIK00485.1 50S ribosomal protein L22 [Candidatus Naiadarchaeum limnaeum]